MKRPTTPITFRLTVRERAALWALAQAEFRTERALISKWIADEVTGREWDWEWLEQAYTQRQEDKQG